MLVALWVSALPHYFGAHDGITSDGTPTGNIYDAAACFVVAATAVFSVVTKPGASRSAAPAEHAVH